MVVFMDYLYIVFNLTSLKSLGFQTPYESLEGQTPDVSMIIRLKFWDPILFKCDKSRGFPNKVEGQFVAFSESVGHKMTYKVLH